MFDAFGVVFGCLRVKPKADQKPQHDLMPVAAFLGQCAAFLSQKNGAILGAGDQAIPGKTAESLGNGGCRDAHLGCNVDGTRFALIVNQFGDQLDVVFRQFIAPCHAHALKRLGAGVASPGFRLDCIYFLEINVRHQFSFARNGLTRKGTEQIVSLV